MENLTSQQLALIAANPCLTQVEPAIQQTITQSIYVKRLQKGQYLHRRSDLAIGYYGVVSGRLRGERRESRG